MEQLVHITVDSAKLEGSLVVPRDSKGIVLFAHGSGSSRHSPRNRSVALALQKGGLSTLLMDLLTAEEEASDLYTAQYRFNVDLLAHRLVGAIDWLTRQEETRLLSIGSFGSSTGAAAALIAAVKRSNKIKAVVSRGGRPDLARSVLPEVTAPTLLIVGEKDVSVVRMNEEALDMLKIEKKMEIVSGATHLFEEPGALDKVSQLARKWFEHFLTGKPDQIKYFAPIW